MSLISGLIANSNAKKTRKQQEEANELAETRAREAAALDETRDDTDASIVFGASEAGDFKLRRKARRGTAASTGAIGSVGGLSPRDAIRRLF